MLLKHTNEKLVPHELRLALVTVLTLGIVALGGALAQDHQRGASATDLAAVQPTMTELFELRQMLAEFEDVEAAKAAGYEQFGECMSGPQGSQGIHFTKGSLIENPTLDVMQPEALMYEPRPDGSLRLIGLEYIVFQDAWHGAGNEAAPALLGQEFVLNTTLLDDPFYALHVWVWQHNPLGLFANWNPLVGCPDSGSQ